MLQTTYVQTLCRYFQKARKVNCTLAAFPSRPDVLVDPAGDSGDATGQCVLDLRQGGIITNNQLLIEPFGVGTGAFTMRLLGWKSILTTPGAGQIAPVSGGIVQWHATPLGDFTCTLGTQTGIAGGVIDNTNNYCDTMTITTATTSAAALYTLVSPANGTQAFLLTNWLAMEILEILFNKGATTSCNALITVL
jgi:hypothetical protein